MLKKILSGAAIAASVLAMAMPAGAIVNERHASFGPNGRASLGFSHGHWIGSAHLKGLAPGHYVVYGYMFEDNNHDGRPDGGATDALCRVVFTAKRQSDHCKGSTSNPFLDLVRGAGHWGEINGISVIRVEDNQLVLDQPLS